MVLEAESPNSKVLSWPGNLWRFQGTLLFPGHPLARRSDFSPPSHDYFSESPYILDTLRDHLLDIKSIIVQHVLAQMLNQFRLQSLTSENREIPGACAWNGWELTIQVIYGGGKYKNDAASPPVCYIRRVPRHGYSRNSIKTEFTLVSLINVLCFCLLKKKIPDLCSNTDPTNQTCSFYEKKTSLAKNWTTSIKYELGVTACVFTVSPGLCDILQLWLSAPSF